jgi:hypothetical protein
MLRNYALAIIHAAGRIFAYHHQQTAPHAIVITATNVLFKRNAYYTA